MNGEAPTALAVLQGQADVFALFAALGGIPAVTVVLTTVAVAALAIPVRFRRAVPLAIATMLTVALAAATGTLTAATPLVGLGSGIVALGVYHGAQGNGGRGGG